METVEFGKTGRKVSRVGFGGAPAGLPNYLRPYDPANPDARGPVLAAIRRAVELGINYFDTAPGYGDGDSERLIGEGLEGVPSEELFIATKVGIWKENNVRESLEQSLKNLKRDYVDLLQVHGTCYNAEHAERILRKGGYLDQMEALKSEGLIRHIGFTAEAYNQAYYDIFAAADRFDSVQLLYNVAHQHAADFAWKSGPVFEAEEKGLGIAVMRSTTSGLLQKWIAAANPENTFNYTPAIVQFQFSNPLVDVALLGMGRPETVEKNVALCNDTSGRFDLEEFFNRRV